jgi:iron complex outermembrane receptor protein
LELRAGSDADLSRLAGNAASRPLRDRLCDAHGVGSLFVDNTGNPGLNTSLNPQTSQGVDFGFDWTPAGTNRIARVTLFNEWWHDEFLSQLTPAATTYISNIPASIHRGVEATIDWKPRDGWRLIGNYTYNDQFFKNLNDTLAVTPVTGANYAVGIQRSGDRLPGVPRHQFTGRIAYDQPFGDLKGLCAFIEYQFRRDVPMDNANLMMWTASPQRHHSAKAWSPERHKEGDRP